MTSTGGVRDNFPEYLGVYDIDGYTTKKYNIRRPEYAQKGTIWKMEHYDEAYPGDIEHTVAGEWVVIVVFFAFVDRLSLYILFRFACANILQ